MINLVFLIFWLGYYIFFQVNTIYGGDAGDLASAAYVGGSPHPPGFPLYTFLSYLVTRIPFGTVAWRMSFLSSIPEAFALYFLYLSLKKIFKQSFAPLIAVLIVGFTYPVWLYAISVEVFPLNIFFASFSIYLLLLWQEKKSLKIFFLFCFIYGLGFFHHQIIIFLLPAFIYFIYQNRKCLPKKDIKYYFFSIILFFSGAIPYLYAYIAAKNIPEVMWGNPWNLTNIIKLFTREYYGTFVTGLAVANKFTTRLISSLVYFEFLYEDLTLIGIIFILAGAIKQIYKIIKHNKKSINEIFIFLIFIFSGPFYFLYASYIPQGQFHIATAEKFLTFSYPLSTFYLCEGIIIAVKILEIFFNKLLRKDPAKFKIAKILYPFFLLIPFLIFYINFPKISILKNDFTPENFAEDILTTPEKNSLLFLQNDTPIFNTFYIYYTKRLRSDIKLFYLARVANGEYKEQIKKYYPDILIPKTKTEEFFSEFVAKNYDKFPIYSNVVFSDNPEVAWVRYGLLFRMYKKKDLPSPQKTLLVNEKLWKNYHNPLTGSLRNYKNLFLQNTLDFYSQAHREYGIFLANIKQNDKAIFQLQQAIILSPDEKDNYYQTSLIYSQMNACQKAEWFLEKADIIAKNNKDKESQGYYLYTRYKIAKDCEKDKNKAEILIKKSKDFFKKLQLPLNEL